MSVTTVSILLLLCSTSLAHLINVTIDDEYGDERTGLKPEYQPGGTSDWLFMSDKRYPGSFDYLQVHNATLHESMIEARGNMTLTFNGTAIYVFFVLNSVYDMDILFYLDGASQPSGNYTRPANPVTGLDSHLYNQLTYQRDALHPGTHHVRVSFSPTANELFDYALYTTDDGQAAQESLSTATGSHASPGPSAKPFPSATPRPSSKLGPAVGASLAGAVLVTLFCIWLFVRMRRRVRHPQNKAADSGKVSGRTGTAAVVVPFAAPPTEPVISPTGTHNEKSDNPLKQTAEDGRLPGESIAMFSLRAELERVRAESEQARAENERVREEIELLRRVAVPPPYSDGGRGNAEGRA